MTCTVIAICLLIEMIYKPRIDDTGDKIILWYNKGMKRHFKILFRYE